MKPFMNLLRASFEFGGIRLHQRLVEFLVPDVSLLHIAQPKIFFMNSTSNFSSVIITAI